jgi:hypothetical protein
VSQTVGGVLRNSGPFRSSLIESSNKEYYLNKITFYSFFEELSE